jgi:hypothetical protein
MMLLGDVYLFLLRNSPDFGRQIIAIQKDKR